MNRDKLLWIAVGTFLLTHARPVMQSLSFSRGYTAAVQELSLGEETVADLELLRQRCRGEQCDLVTYAQAHEALWLLVPYVQERNGVHTLDELLGSQAYLQESQNTGASSRDLFMAAAQTSHEPLRTRSLHNKDVLDALMLDQYDEVHETDEEQTQDGEEREDVQELSQQEQEELQEYADHLQEQQKTYQSEFDASGKQRDVFKGLEVLEDLLRPDLETGGDEVKDW